MNTGFTLAVCTVACAYLTGCTKSPPSVAVTALAYQEFYTSTSDYADVSPIAYRVVVAVTNTGSSPVVFDIVQCAFIPGNGKPLLDTIHPYDQAKGDDRSAYEDNLKSAAIAAGGGETFSFTTDGYTFKLLRDAGTGPLEFVVILMKGGSPVVGPFAAVLPSPKDLPQYEFSVRSNTPGKVLPLRYSRKGQ